MESEAGSARDQDLSFVLLVIPCLYSIPDDLGWTTKVEAEEAHA